VLVPATVVLLGRWNWWPSRLSRQPADRPGDEGRDEGGGGGGDDVPSAPPVAPEAEPGKPVASPPR
jgi:RND superfamily putative drug exporter